jgi:hypothetical protein
MGVGGLENPSQSPHNSWSTHDLVVYLTCGSRSHQTRRLTDPLHYYIGKPLGE